MKRIVIIDTNTLLHYKRLDQINWLSDLKTLEVTILLPLVVIEELEKHKVQHPVKKLKRRASDYVKWINSVTEDDLEVEIRQGVTLRILDYEPTLHYSAFRLSKDMADDRLLAQAIEWNQDHPDTPATIVTADTGVRVRAKGRKLDVIFWQDNDYKLPDESDPDQLLIQQLQREKAELESKIPKLKVHFPGGLDDCAFDLVANAVERAEFGLLRAKRQHRKMDTGDSPIAKSEKTEDQRIVTIDELMAYADQMSHEIDGITLAARYDYNDALDKYFEKLHNYWEKHTYRAAHVIELEMEVSNSGTCPAQSLLLELSLPSNVDSFFDIEMDEIEDEPLPPDLPQPEEDYEIRTEQLHDTWRFLPDIVPQMANLRGPFIDEERRKVSYQFIKLTHGMVERLDPFYVVLNNPETVDVLPIGYKFIADNLPRPLTGVVIARIRKVKWGHADDSDGPTYAP